jgi:hypothetical protein
MPYEYSTQGGVLRLLKAGSRWALEFHGHRRAQWTSSDAAVRAVVRHSTGLAEWDQKRLSVSDDLLRWRPIGENL